MNQNYQNFQNYNQYNQRLSPPYSNSSSRHNSGASNPQNLPILSDFKPEFSNNFNGQPYSPSDSLSSGQCTSGSDSSPTNYDNSIFNFDKRSNKLNESPFTYTDKQSFDIDLSKPLAQQRPILRKHKLKRAFEPNRDRIDYSHVTDPKERRRLRSQDNARLYRDREKQRIMNLESGIEYITNENKKLVKTGNWLRNGIDLMIKVMKQKGIDVDNLGIDIQKTLPIKQEAIQYSPKHSWSIDKVLSPPKQWQNETFNDSISEQQPRKKLKNSYPAAFKVDEMTKQIVGHQIDDPKFNFGNFDQNFGQENLKACSNVPIENLNSTESKSCIKGNFHNDTQMEFSLISDNGNNNGTLPDLNISPSEVAAFDTAYTLNIRENHFGNRLSTIQELSEYSTGQKQSFKKMKNFGYGNLSGNSSGSRNKLGLSLNLSGKKNMSQETNSSSKTICDLTKVTSFNDMTQSPEFGLESSNNFYNKPYNSVLVTSTTELDTTNNISTMSSIPDPIAQSTMLLSKSKADILDNFNMDLNTPSNYGSAEPSPEEMNLKNNKFDCEKLISYNNKCFSFG